MEIPSGFACVLRLRILLPSGCACGKPALRLWRRDAELDPVTFFLEKEEARVRVPLPDSSGKEVTLSLKKYPEAWGLKVEGDMDFHFSSFLVRDEEGMVLPEYAWRQGSSFFPGSGQESGKSRFWETGYLVPEKIRSLKVTVSYWNKVALRQVPLDLRIGAGGMMAP
ncbi:MAG: hypothetical protein ACLU7D_08555 [Collinsella sp.]